MSTKKVEIVPGDALDCTGGYTNTGNFCALQYRRNSDDTVDGETIFVKTDCQTRVPLPMEQQDLIYRNKGVAYERGMYGAFAAAWNGPDSSKNGGVGAICFPDDGANISAYGLLDDYKTLYESLYKTPGQQILSSGTTLVSTDSLPTLLYKSLIMS